MEVEHARKIREIIKDGSEDERQHLQQLAARFACALSEVLPPDFAAESLQAYEAGGRSEGLLRYSHSFSNTASYAAELYMLNAPSYGQLKWFDKNCKNDPALLLTGHMEMATLLLWPYGDRSGVDPDQFAVSLAEFLYQHYDREDLNLNDKVNIHAHLPGALAQIVALYASRPEHAMPTEDITSTLALAKSHDKLEPDAFAHGELIFNVVSLLRQCYFAGRDKAFCEGNIRALRQFYATDRNRDAAATAEKALGRIMKPASGHAKAALKKPVFAQKGQHTGATLNAERAAANIIMFMNTQYLLDDLGGDQFEDIMSMYPAILFKPGKSRLSELAQRSQVIEEQIERRHQEVALDWHVLYPGVGEGTSRKDTLAVVRSSIAAAGTSETHDFSRIDLLMDLIEMFDATKTADDPLSYIAWSRSKDIEAGRPPTEARDLWCIAVLVDTEGGELREHVVADNAYVSKRGTMHSLHCLRAEVGDWTQVFKESTKPQVRNAAVRLIRHRGDVAGRVLEYLVRDPQYLKLQYMKP